MNAFSGPSFDYFTLFLDDQVFFFIFLLRIQSSINSIKTHYYQMKSEIRNLNFINIVINILKIKL